MLHLKIGQRVFLAVSALLLGVLLFGGTSRVWGQGEAGSPSPPSAYWQYDAPGPLGLVDVADVDNDGSEEFVLTTDAYQAVLLNATGEDEWTYQAPGQSPILQLTTINVDGADDPHLEILLATEEELILLNHEKELLWQKPLSLPPLPRSALTGASGDALESVLNNQPVMLIPFDRERDGNEEILILLKSGLVQLYDGQGQFQWEYPESPPVSDDPFPRLQAADLDRDGREEIVFSYYIKYSRVVLLDGDGEARWEKSLSGRITALSLVAWDERSPLDIAVGNTFQDRLRQVVLLNHADGSELWKRTPNRTVTSLNPAQLPDERALIVGTDAGSVAAYNRYGRRLWHYLPDSPERAVVSLAPNPVESVQTGQPTLAFTLASSGNGGNEGSAVVLLDENGQEMQRFQSATGETRLVDVNGDRISELMLASFGTLSLTDPGTGARQNTQAWDYRLYFAPRCTLVADLNQDGADELLVGTRDGRLHFLESDSGQASSIVNLGGEVSHLALIGPNVQDGERLVAAVHNHPADPRTGQEAQGFVELIQPSGRVVWPDAIAIPAEITTLAAGNLNRDVATEIVVGTREGDLIAYSLGPRELWRAKIPGSVEHLVLADEDGDAQREVVVSNSSNQIYRFSGDGSGGILANYNLLRIQALFGLARAEDDERALLVATNDGLLRGLTWRGAEPWQWSLAGGEISRLQPAGDSFLVAGDDGRLLELDLESNSPRWQLNGLGDISAVYWGDLDGGGSRDVAVGSRNGEITLFTDEARRWDGFRLSSGSNIFALSGVRRSAEQQPQLVAITDTGLVQLFEAKPNRPPLLANSRVEVGPGRYDVELNVIEETGDTVTISLELYDDRSGEWVIQEERTVSGRSTVLFPLSPVRNNSVRYRFRYNDGTHSGTVTPSPGPLPQPVNTLRNAVVLPGLLIVGLLTILLLIRQALSTEARARRFYRRLKQQPSQTLDLLGQELHQGAGSPDFLLNLANRARGDQQHILANLADGLFLLCSRPSTGVPIIHGALTEAKLKGRAWRNLEDWHRSFSLAQRLLDAQSITELSLLRPELEQVARTENNDGARSAELESLVPVLNSLHDSERVDQAEDRIVYLHEATVLLRQLAAGRSGDPSTLEDRLLAIVEGRILGLANAEMEALRGKAQLVANLKTKRIVAEEGVAVVALEIQNNGRADAEQLLITVDQDPAYEIRSEAETLPVLAPGRAHVAQFRLEPCVEDRFRVAFSIHFDDRIRKRRRLAFADMVHLLPPQRDFSPIDNPYMPGTPLRSDSPLFYGREELFEFIIDNAGKISRRDVLILIGQRRMGKTSALLRLGQHLPRTLLPVYIDCQSLGVVPGMPAFFHDLAWHIADVAGERGYPIEVPDVSAWQADPARLFRQDFIPAVRRTLPEKTKLLLVFDEFEALENLVQDGVLPRTLFTYLRHMMQHSEGFGFIFVGTRRLEQMTSDYWSVLFNIALYGQIGFLSREATAKLITEPVSPHIIYDDLALDKIWRVTAGHPYFLQLVCYTLVKRANRRRTGYITISDVNAALDEMLQLGEVHFAYIWRQSTYAERALLAAVAHLMDRDVPFHPADLVQYLEQYGFRFNPAEITAGLNRLVEREIMREITEKGTTLYELRIGLVGLWAAQNKSLSKLYESKNGSDERVLRMNGLSTR